MTGADDDRVLEFHRRFLRRCADGEVPDLQSMLDPDLDADTAVVFAREYCQLVGGGRDGSDSEAEPERFQRLRVLGRGGQGEVTLAYDRSLRRHVAIKTLHRTSVEQLRREAQRLGSIRNDSVCKVHDVLDTGPAIVMQYEEGASLEELIERARETGRAPVLRAPGAGRDVAWMPIVRAFLQLAQALDAAHDVGVLHRDLKPGNIIIRPSGEPVLLDFGIAASRCNVVEGVIVWGTAAYMAPEVAAGGIATPQSDTYSLVASLVESLTLETVREAEEHGWRGLSHLPGNLRRVIDRGLHPKPSRRYTAAALAADLERVLRHQPVGRCPWPERIGLLFKADPWTMGSVSVAFALLLLLAAGSWLATGAIERRNVALQESEQQTELALGEIQRVLANTWPGSTMDTVLDQFREVTTTLHGAGGWKLGSLYASILGSHGRHAEAEEQVRRALASPVASPEERVVLQCLLAQCLVRQGRPAAAKEPLRIAESTLDEMPPADRSTRSGYWNIRALLARYEGRADDAVSHARRAVEVLGEDPTLATNRRFARENLALLLSEAGRHEDALRWIDRAAPDPRAPLMVTLRHGQNRATIFERAGRPGSTAMLEASFAKHEKELGADHEDTLRAGRNLGLHCMRIDALHKGEDVLRKILTSRTAKRGAARLEAQAAADLALVLVHRREIDAAARVLDRARPLLPRVEDLKILGEMRFTSGCVALAQGQGHLAARELQRSVEHFAKRFGRDHRETLRAEAGLAQACLFDRGPKGTTKPRIADAMRHARHAVTGFRRLRIEHGYGPFVDALGALACALGASAKPKEALAILRERHEILESTRSPNDRDLGNTKELVARCLMDLKETVEARRWAKAWRDWCVRHSADETEGNRATALLRALDERSK